MPFVNVKTAKGLLNDDQKRQLHRRLSELMVEVEGHGNRDFLPYVSILIEEIEPSAWTVQGEALTAKAVADLQDHLRGA